MSQEIVITYKTTGIDLSKSELKSFIRSADSGSPPGLELHTATVYTHTEAPNSKDEEFEERSSTESEFSFRPARRR
jgi:hypothetical protein